MADSLDEGRLAAAGGTSAKVEEARGGALQQCPQLGRLLGPLYVGPGLLQTTAALRNMLICADSLAVSCAATACLYCGACRARSWPLGACDVLDMPIAARG